METSFARSVNEIRQVRQVRYDFTGSVALVTGAAHGQGREFALAFAAAGADVVVCDLGQGSSSSPYPLGTERELNEVADLCREQGVRCLPLVCDVREEVQVEAMVRVAIDRCGRIDILVNNAGITTIREVVNLEEASWDAIIDTNLKGVYLCSKFAAREMKRAGRGRIITIASVHSFTGIPGSAHYAAAKHGVAGFSKSLAIELAPFGITVNYVCPTAVNTPMVEIMGSGEVPPGHGERLVATTGSWNLLREGAPPLEPQEVAHAVLWLASDAAEFVTGSALMVDAGFTAK